LQGVEKAEELEVQQSSLAMKVGVEGLQGNAGLLLQLLLLLLLLLMMTIIYNCK
jgi:hypothetical protein